MTQTPTGIRLAATVLLYRHTPGGLEVFWVRRGEQLSFAGGFYAFPGGGVDDADRELPLRYALRLSPDESACVAAAARELFEETGVLLVPGASAVPASERRRAREAMLGGSEPFAHFLAAHDLAVDAQLFKPAGRWITPPVYPVRFDARFHLAELPPGETAEVWPGELSDGAWVKPAEALARWEAGAALLHPPAWHSLKALALGIEAALPLLADPSRASWALPMRDCVVERMEFQRGIVMVPLRTETLPPATHTNCLLLGIDELWIVDPGSPYPEEQLVLEETLAALAREGRVAKGILLTHHHRDHVAGARILADKLGLPIAATEETRRALPRDVQVSRIVRDGDALPAGPRGFRSLHLPGHTRGHLCLIEESTGTVVAGDLVAGLGTVIIDPPEGDMSDYLASLRRLLGLGPGTVYPAHGPIVPAGAEKLRTYLAHRLEREERVVRALASAAGPATPKDLLPESYPDVAPELYPLAERSLLAHLQKLVREGRAREDADGRFRPS